MSEQVEPDDSVSEQAPVVEVTDVTLKFKGVTAINGVSFAVGAQELFAIIGPNGAGKTSIFNVLSGVYRPQQGTVRFLGEDVLGRAPHDIAARGMARTFQNIELFENLTVIDNLMLGRAHRVRYGMLSAAVWFGRARRSELVDRAAVEEIVDFLELAAFRGSPVGLLPYGIQKRVELGRALAMGPRLLLLDEPVAGMNLEETEDMARFILDIRDELQVPLIMVEHDMGLVMDLADRVMVVDFGVPITTGTPAQVQENPDVIKAYLGEDHATGGRRSQAAPTSGGTP
ncbi:MULTISPECIES: ABC transporter ATP-binding protein [unclassified Geodermatophilus]|uniref:ABC transporter ATP-binding protein n=1 Tax=unclassified Geodermatophilus TaxID=2637632 RepID=UPI003EE8938A